VFLRHLEWLKDKADLSVCFVSIFYPLFASLNFPICEIDLPYLAKFSLSLSVSDSMRISHKFIPPENISCVTLHNQQFRVLVKLRMAKYSTCHEDICYFKTT
jgi:hypothetical protein